jgi:peroxidase
MAASFRDGAVVGLCLMAMLVVGSIGAEAQLTIDFYDDSCPQIYDIVKAEIRKAVAAEARMAASLVRLHFHDCFVNGCDGSILLNSTTDFQSEQFSLANNNSIRGFNVIDTIKAKLEAACPGTVSCADIVAIASRDSAVEAGLTPGYPVFFGRRDSLNHSQADADLFLPSPFDDYPTLKQSFENVTLDEVDLVALSGAHTIGRVHCQPVVLSNITLNDTTSGFDPVFHQRPERDRHHQSPAGGRLPADRLVRRDCGHRFS